VRRAGAGGGVRICIGERLTAEEFWTAVLQYGGAVAEYGLTASSKRHTLLGRCLGGQARSFDASQTTRARSGVVVIAGAWDGSWPCPRPPNRSQRRMRAARIVLSWRRHCLVAAWAGLEFSPGWDKESLPMGFPRTA
jgi:hypothetical protein